MKPLSSSVVFNYSFIMTPFIRIMLVMALIYANHYVVGQNISDNTGSFQRQTRGVEATRWSYNGPSYWPIYFHGCAGREQSPINIDVKKMWVKNNGHSVELEPISKYNLPFITHGGLPGTFVMHHLHFHWGASDNWGSEHTLNHKPFPFEVHIVHYNQKYGSIDHAKHYRDGLAVLAIFAKEDDDPAKVFQRIDSNLDRIKENGKRVRLNSAIRLNEFLPRKTNEYFRYHGSLTTPVCNEIVTWTVFREPIKISEKQLKAYRSKIYDSKGQHLINNFRPVQPSNHRKVFLNVG